MAKRDNCVLTFVLCQLQLLHPTGKYAVAATWHRFVNTPVLTEYCLLESRAITSCGHSQVIKKKFFKAYIIFFFHRTRHFAVILSDIKKKEKKKKNEKKIKAFPTTSQAVAAIHNQKLTLRFWRRALTSSLEVSLPVCLCLSLFLSFRVWYYYSWGKIHTQERMYIHEHQKTKQYLRLLIS